VIWRLRDEADVYAARREARALARSQGFGSRESAEICIAVSELAWNIVKFAGRGELEVRPVESPTHGRGLEIVASDAGPPLHDLRFALEDGCDDRGPLSPESLFGRRGIGGGLGAVRRFTDELSYDATPAGKRFVAVRWQRRPR